VLDGFGGLHRIVQGPSLDMLIRSLHWGEQLNQGETPSGTCAFSNSVLNRLQKNISFSWDCYIMSDSIP